MAKANENTKTLGNENTEDQKIEGTATEENNTSNTEAASDGFDWVSEDEVKKPTPKYDWASFPAPREVDGKMRYATKRYEGGGSKTLYGSYNTYVSKIEAENEKITKENAEIAAANAKLEEGDPARKHQKELKLVPEFTNSEVKDKPGKAGKVLAVVVTRLK